MAQIQICPNCKTGEFTTSGLRYPRFACKNGHQFHYPKTVDVEIPITTLRDSQSRN